MKVIVKLQANKIQDVEIAREIWQTLGKLEDKNGAIADLESLYDEIMKDWSNIRLQRNIGHVRYSAALMARVKAQFEGNRVDFNAFRLIFPVFTSPNKKNFAQDSNIHLKTLQACSILSLVVRPRSSFLREESSGLRDAPRKRISPTPQILTTKASAALLSAKMATPVSTDLIVGRYARLVSFTRNKVSIEFVKFDIYNSGNKAAEVFSAKEESGSLVWHIRTPLWTQ
ncbi:hypothetical protein F5890DRAFT_1604820 [Lentinula detonsa]|uniref:Uncharacterized protein n=1 Tax=Lentinula detonsa TaxID=2804962 RepID=A0AA38Q753_9AGAR|nr:hypothetical protein F5890DRAFT_1604820 [Lentinula detonsa]